ncbi:PPR domain-containing protein/PPR_2 domain-containing protein/PPR_3 domain-containing protein [Cephalotus follicularis]|uniref:PPR domain-containing protein/PPR_2 domain-containing protein/PPR_3 domain-containing protein n=1 Tax=Cephalotus follicularis TaxID=3775 RepID=A0A1Q3CBI9_CEPFO|nr:PPR domain-containing protein/PPR_2 domain-containing protein/PPR_3 domain-containing protein [Cephalotus follicularis]
MRPLNYDIEIFSYALYKVLTKHCWVIKLGSFADVYTTNNILSGYTKCKELGVACKLFDEMTHRDSVSWNTMIAGCVNSGNFDTAWVFLKTMKRCGFDADGYTFGSILKGVAGAYRLGLGQQVHSTIVKMGYEGNVYAGSALLDMYAKCERVEDAYAVFQCIPERNSVTYNALIDGFVQVSDLGSAFWLLDCMEKEGVRLDDGSFAPLLTLLDDAAYYKLTMQMHCKIIKHGLAFDNTVCNATITSYAECGSLEDAKRVFEGAIGSRDLVTWNSMLAAYLVHEKELAFKLFVDMQGLGFEPDFYTYTSVISACFEKVHKDHGKSLHGLVIKRGLEKSVPISNALIAMYLKLNNKSMEDTLHIFDSMESKDRVSWNSMLTGFSQCGFSEYTLKLFAQMRSLLVEIDHYAFSAVLRSCSDLATLQLGQQVHVLAIKSGFTSNDFVGSSLIFMYSRCGIIEDAQKSFEETSKDSSITWNSIIFGYAQHGQGEFSLNFFFQMRERKVKLDHITFVAVLTACSHIGLVEEGHNFFKSMEIDYGIPPRMEHYACVVDLFGRAGRLLEAKTLVESMPFEPDAMVWKTLLGACRVCCDIELATEVASHLLELQPEEHCTYVLLSNMYGNLRRWDEKASVTRLMRESKVKKVPGWSWIEIKNEVHAFNAEDRFHPHCAEIYHRLGELMEEIKWLDSTASLDVIMPSFDHE